MTRSESPDVSRAGQKLAAALDAFQIDPAGLICADLGSNVGGFVEVLLRRGALRIYAIERGYGVLAYALRNDPRVVVRERTDALRVRLPEPVDLVTIDVAWTRQEHILPVAKRLLKQPDGRIITLIKPHYEAQPDQLLNGVLPQGKIGGVLDGLCTVVRDLSLDLKGELQSPITGRGGNVEYLWHLVPANAAPPIGTVDS